MDPAIEASSTPHLTKPVSTEAIPAADSVKSIKGLIEKRFGKIFDEQTKAIVNKPYNQINLKGHCGEVSTMSQSVVGGEVKQKVTKGNKPAVYYLNPDGTTMEIASGYTRAIHSYVVDEKGKVWDPITNNWGLIEEKEYLDRMM